MASQAWEPNATGEGNNVKYVYIYRISSNKRLPCLHAGCKYAKTGNKRRASNKSGVQWVGVAA